MVNRFLQIAFILCIISYILYGLASTLADPDLWGYLAFGRLFWNSSSFPYQDVFSYVPTLNPWVYHEWLTGVVFYPIYQSLGAPGLQFLKYALGLATLTFIYLTAVRRGAHPAVAGILLAAAAGAIKMSYSPVRAQVFTFFFFALSLYILERARLSGRFRGLWLLPLIQIPWCNLHGGFVAGLGLIGIYAAGEFLARRPWLPYLGILLLSALATLINPYGLEYWHYIVMAVAKPRPHVVEWATVFELYQKGVYSILALFYVFLFVFLGLFAMWRYGWREVTASLALAVTMVLGLKHNRHLTFFFILWGAYIPVCMNVQVNFVQSIPGLVKIWRGQAANLTLSVSLVALTLAFSYLLVQQNPLTLKLLSEPARGHLHFPMDAVNYIKENGLSGKVVTRFAWGEYLIWELYPHCLVAFDGRYETVYPEEVDQKYDEFHFARPKWRQFLESYPPDLILLDPNQEIAGLITKEPGWQKIYEDSGSVLFKKHAVNPVMNNKAFSTPEVGLKHK
ncbi:MAG: hypothetical protein QME75_15915 [Deltaproteobacteria bacterium]|nr:hypothetical protein [Desulfitobacteriaceae bacterium]MDI6855079.1 hypothetical protein [Deltaproteobacteria bacterium]